MFQRIRFAPTWFHGLLVVALFGTLSGAAPFVIDEKPPEKPNLTPGLVEARFADDSSMKMTLREVQIEIVTPYGKLRVPFGEVQQIEFATRIPPDVQKRIDTALAELADGDAKVRELAVAELLKHKDRAYPALAEAAKSADAGIKSRVEDVLEKLRESLPEGQPIFRKFDTIHTEEMKISGRIEVATWKAKTSQFGDVEVRLADLRGLKVPGLVEETTEVLNPLPDPGSLGAYAGMIGKKFAFRVTGIAGNGLYGTETYTTDSSLANAAVHWGALKNGQTGIVKVEIVNPPGAYVGSTRNGCTSSAYGVYNGAFKVLLK